LLGSQSVTGLIAFNDLVDQDRRTILVPNKCTQGKCVMKILVMISAMMFSLVAAADHHGDMKHSMAKSDDIVDVAIENGNFTTLVTAVKAAGLVDTLKGAGPFTVFAPTDAAFAKVPTEMLNALLADKAALANVLTYHVVAGKVMASDVVTLSQATTIQGQNIMIEVRDGKVFVNNAQVVITDVNASNGVIHVIDTVILPKS
jgi:uncharacterized surface protein with fasciclin (FAS1) repeats